MTQHKPERLDTEYRRNGTTNLIAAMDISSGKIISQQMKSTRNAEDFLDHVKSIVDTAPNDQHIIICDQLNTHKSAILVKWIAKQINYKEDLGLERESGILKSMVSRMQFLESKCNRIRFQFTPKHCSWLNQIENWFSRLHRSVLSNGQFESVEKLKIDMLQYIDYYNKFLYKPINWSFSPEKFMEKIKV